MTATRGFSFTTKYTTLEAFVAGFHRCCDRESMVLHTSQQHLEGDPCAFKILLADKTPVLVGTAIVREVFTDGANRFGRPGVRLEISQLAANSEPVFARLQAVRAQRNTSPLPKAQLTGLATPTSVTATRSIRPITVQIPRRKVATASPVEVRAEGSGETQTRTPGSALVLPANPLMNLTDASLEGFVDCRLFEASSGAQVKPVEPAGSAIPGLELPIPMLVETAPELPTPVAEPRAETPSEPAASPAIVGARPRRWRFVAGAAASAIVALAVVAWLAHDGDGTHVPLPHIAMPAPIAAPVVTPVATPPTQVAAPVKPPLYMVLVQSSPSAAGVTYAGRFVGYTPTYVHVPALTPVRIEIERKGWKPVTETITGQHPGDRVTVQLEYAGARRPQPKRESFERPPI